ncbi:MAG: ABC transporter ATP-binding protein [Bacteroidales bacterium]|nr:ABC transporter ATP-binding protein [Bacteroidales bacterium]
MIKCSNIKKSFGQLPVLKGIDFHAKAGEVVSIVGASGAGKSTLLQILGSLMLPDSGTVTIDGTDISSLKGNALSDFRNRRIGFVFQFHHLLPEFTALENVMMPALIERANSKGKGASVAQIKEQAISLLKELGLAGRVEHKPSELSGGEQQRVAIARALINRPAVLFADEPSGNLDSKTRDEIHNLFFELRDKFGQTIIIVTHDKDLAMRSDRVVEMVDGKFV